MRAFWAEGLSDRMNVTLAFVLDLGKRTEAELKIAGASCFKIYSDGSLVGFGPQRAAHGYARVGNDSLCGRYVALLAESCNVKNYCWIKQPPFLAAEILCRDGRRYELCDFRCYRLTDRVEKVPRYSYQRGFAEIYRMDRDRRALLKGRTDLPALPLTEVACPQLLPSRVGNARLGIHLPASVVECGRVSEDPAAPVWRDRAHTDVDLIGGFPIAEWEECATDEVSRFVFECGKRARDQESRYRTYDFGRAITGFIELEIEAAEKGSVHFIFDEILWKEAGKGENHVGFERNTCSNVIKWTVNGKGWYRVASFEPYTVRYARVVCTRGVKARPFLRDYENPSADRFRFRCADDRLNKIVEAARATLAQNAADVLTDCPSRERAGWLSDSYFSSVAERVFTGDTAAERTLLENYVLADRSGLPRGMVPMCYPADNYDGTYIPNWALWYILEIAKFAKIHPDDPLVAKSKENVFGILGFFANYENEEGMLENLQSWIFVEWSAANAPDHVCGVNVPTNFCYAAALAAAGRTYGDERLIARAQKLSRTVREAAFNGEFFADNLIRDGEGKLQRTENLTEVCQYYAFWTGCAKREEYPALFERMTAEYGETRDKALRALAKPNVMYGIYMRLDLLMTAGERERIAKECVGLFSEMAERTGTLWEHKGIEASCDHGFASYAVRWILYALTGIDVLYGAQDCDPQGGGIGIDCEFSLPLPDGKRFSVRISGDRKRCFTE
ncbi:MAG: hypothetical protein ACI4ST_07020 [Candidatus Gallimonas sp.]